MLAEGALVLVALVLAEIVEVVVLGGEGMLLGGREGAFLERA